MGTRSLTHIYDEWWDEPRLLLTIYRQFDGYPEGHGADLREFISSKGVVNGISGDEDVFNGPGDLAAQLVAHLKTREGGIEAGHVYIQEPGATDLGEEWVYTIRVRKDDVHLEVTECRYEGDTTFYEGPVNEFIASSRELT